jgi:hypothetical protein
MKMPCLKLREVILSFLVISMFEGKGTKLALLRKLCFLPSFKLFFFLLLLLLSLCFVSLISYLPTIISLCLYRSPLFLVLLIYFYLLVLLFVSFLPWFIILSLLVLLSFLLIIFPWLVLLFFLFASIFFDHGCNNT